MKFSLVFLLSWECCPANHSVLKIQRRNFLGISDDGGGLVTKSCPTIVPGSSVPGILQARILEWVAISFSRGSSQPRNQTQVSCIAGRFFTAEPPGTPTQTVFSFEAHSVTATGPWALSLVGQNHRPLTKPLPQSQHRWTTSHSRLTSLISSWKLQHLNEMLDCKMCNTFTCLNNWKN